MYLLRNSATNSRKIKWELEKDVRSKSVCSTPSTHPGRWQHYKAVEKEKLRKQDKKRKTVEEVSLNRTGRLAGDRRRDKSFTVSLGAGRVYGPRFM